MNVLQAIKTRRTIRSFFEVPVEMALAEEIVQLANCAPSAGSARPWQFIICDNQDVLVAASKINPYADHAAKAPMGIFVLGDPAREKYRGFWVQDCAACTNTLLLAAHGKGLGSAWTGIYPVKQRVDKFKELLETDPRLIPFSLVLLGYTQQRQSQVPPPPAHIEKSYL